MVPGCGYRDSVQADINEPLTRRDIDCCCIFFRLREMISSLHPQPGFDSSTEDFLKSDRSYLIFRFSQRQRSSFPNEGFARDPIPRLDLVALP